MKKKTINKVINKKVTDWISSINDKELRELIERDVIVTGGCIASMFLKETVNDYDIYFKTLETTFKICEYYSDSMNNRISNSVIPQIIDTHEGKSFVSLDDVKEYSPEKGEDVRYRVRAFVASDGIATTDEYNAEAEFEGSEPIAPNLEQIEEENIKDKYYPIYISSNAITLSHKIQIILRFYGNAEIIHDNYDFVHCTNYWTFETGLITNVSALECLLSKELKYFGSRYPLASILRTKKFINRDWTVNAGQYIKMVFQLNDMDLTDINILEEQLTGVDIAYMHQLINSIKQKQAKDKDFDIKGYFINVVEKIFD